MTKFDEQYMALRATRFWDSTSLADMSKAQWEALCDGCGKCCLLKLEDEDTNEVFYTDVACQYLDDECGGCRDYANRFQNVDDCVSLIIDNLPHWLPSSCAYKRLSNGDALPSWHPLEQGHDRAMHRAGISVRYKVINETRVNDDELEERIIHWV